MSNYLQLSFNCSSEQQEIIIALLSELNYEGFEQNDDSLKAFIKEKDFNEEELKKINASYTINTIPETNWNQLWESNFHPVVVDDFAAIRADFHEPIINVQHEIIITPKMSFGTGHHATTYMMMQNMRELDLGDKTVFDFGTGTGVLAILAEKMGAKKVFAVDNDPWSISNAEENIQRNRCTKVTVQLSDNASTGKRFDIILANINRNVILDNLASLANQLSPDGVLLISGILLQDEEVILSECRKFSLICRKKTQENNWICLRVTY